MAARRWSSLVWSFEVELQSPGHSPGHVSYALPEHGALFSGDVLFEGSVGRVDLPGGDWPTLLASIESADQRKYPAGDESSIPDTWG